MNKLRIGFYGDDFTGSTDALESLALAGLRTKLFTRPPTRQQLDKNLDAIGIAGTTRAMPPAKMGRALAPALKALRHAGCEIIHYKTCSTFDSSPEIGSIGRAIDIGMRVLGVKKVPVIVGAPDLGRWCVFGNLFARFGTEPAAYRLDRHPSISRHPITPMTEADLRLHLAKQTKRSIGLIDIRQLHDLPRAYRNEKAEVVLIDLLDESHLRLVGRFLAEEKPRFVVGSSGVESALAAHWNRRPQRFGSLGSGRPLLVVSGSCSPVTLGQIRYTLDHGFIEVIARPRCGDDVVAAGQQGKSVVLHTNPERRVDNAEAMAAELAQATRRAWFYFQRILVAGGDTSGIIARALGIASLTYGEPLVRGAPIVVGECGLSPVQFIFKGGQIGPADLFVQAEKGTDG